MNKRTEDLEKLLALFQCHKKVRAGRILSTTGRPDGTMTLHLEGGDVHVDADWVRRNPKVESGGYFVLYLEGDGYTSYSPAGPFEGGYRPVEPGYFGFEEALAAMKQGAAVARGLWQEQAVVYLGQGNPAVPASELWNHHSREFAENNGGSAVVHPYFIMRCPGGALQMGWAPVQADLLATDWYIEDGGAINFTSG